MAVVFMHKRNIWIVLVAILSLFIYNEFLVYYFVLLQCHWPQLEADKADSHITPTTGVPLKAMFMADTHLLGSREGHWFDRLRREWQMERSFQTALTLFNPEAVFVLGDLFDEGKWCNDREFNYHVARFSRMFRRGLHNNMHILVGNHDVGFHSMIEDDKLPERLHIISASLDCAQQKNEDGNEDPSCETNDSFPYTRPILLQHFPMYRESDSNCSGIDSAPPHMKADRFMPKWDCLSKDASQKILHLIKPRLIFGGHTHNYCYREHADHTPEWTLASFSWRYKSTPSFLLATISNNNESVKKCYLPSEVTVIYTYIIGAVLIVAWIVLPKKFFAYRPPSIEKSR
ncbi:Metallophosphoesterase 1 [Lamellibrachia satsuma]|nr:Metallophosphoesterase 1 [Lamellibrachia satsuma]